MPSDETEWVTSGEVSRRLGIPESTLAQWRYLGRGPRYAKFGKHVRYLTADVESWESAQVIEPGPTAA